MALLKIPKEVKLKDLPLESRVALRLVTMREQNKTKAEIRPIAKELSAPFKQVMTAIEDLARKGVIKLTPLTSNDFEFEIDELNRKELRLNASNYDKHLKVRADSAHRARNHGSGAPAHLPPIGVEQRQPWMEKGTAIAVQLGAPKLAFKFANCLARLGEEEVNRILNGASVVRNDPKMSVIRLFFTMYSLRRDELLKPKQKAA